RTAARSPGAAGCAGFACGAGRRCTQGLVPSWAGPGLRAGSASHHAVSAHCASGKPSSGPWRGAERAVS
ncbi:MAG: hypothetical protein ACREKR_14145, partial [Candidatus Methylomirabilales bacterium]